MKKMSETCKTCKEKFDFGIWIAPQFKEEGVLLFCSEKCKAEYLKMKLRRIKDEYPAYYSKIVKSAKKKKDDKSMYLPFVEVIKKEVFER